MRATILTLAIILTKAVVSVTAKGCIMASVQPLRCFLFFTTQLY